MSEKPSASTVLDIAGIVLLALQWAYSFYLYLILPEKIPTHFNAAGEADVFGSKGTAWVWPAISTLIFIVLGYISRFPALLRRDHDSAAGAAQVANTRMMIRCLKISIIVVFSGIAAYMQLTVNGTLSGGKSWYLPLLLAISFAPIVPFVYLSMRTGSDV